MRALLAFRPEIAPALGAFTDELLHAPNSLTHAERELIAARVSHLNDCTFCRESHAAIAVCHLVGREELVAAAVADPERAPISEKLKALLALAGRVQQGGGAVGDGDVARARSEGATDREIHDTVLIAAAFCMFNRYVDGLATIAPVDDNLYDVMGARMANEGYVRNAEPAAAR